MLLGALAVLALLAAIWAWGYFASRQEPGICLVEVSPEEVGRVTLESGSTGKRVELTEEAKIKLIVENLGAVRFKKGEPVPDADGYNVILNIYLKDGALYRSFEVDSERQLQYEGYFYKVVSGLIGCDYLEVLAESGE